MKIISYTRGFVFGCVAGLCVVLLMQLFGPQLELFLLRQESTLSYSEYEKYLSHNFIYSTYYVVMNCVAIFFATFISCRYSIVKSRILGGICGLLFFLLVLTNISVLELNIVLYIISVIFGFLVIILALRKCKVLAN